MKFFKALFGTIVDTVSKEHKRQDQDIRRIYMIVLVIVVVLVMFALGDFVLTIAKVGLMYQEANATITIK